MVVQQLSLPLYQQLERQYASPHGGGGGSGGGRGRAAPIERSPPRRAGFSVLVSHHSASLLEPLGCISACLPACLPSRVPNSRLDTFSLADIALFSLGACVQRALTDPLQLCAVQNAVLHASSEFSTALLLLPLPPLPQPMDTGGGGGGGSGGGAASGASRGSGSEWVQMVAELGDGLAPSLFVHNPTAGVIATHI